jgi:hypothetical protein
VDLDIEPVQQPMAGERLLAQRRSLDLARLDRYTAHDARRCPYQKRRRIDRRSARTDVYRCSGRTQRVGDCG